MTHEEKLLFIKEMVQHVEPYVTNLYVLGNDARIRVSPEQPESLAKVLEEGAQLEMYFTYNGISHLVIAQVPYAVLSNRNYSKEAAVSAGNSLLKQIACKLFNLHPSIML
ncbi:hypothetical protein FDI98_gp104 [Vibrio phage JSF10]|uniref:Uncharacterized protein n=1 Tax=Vibrio phage JSF10 TaxID=1983593 RepID=A0A2D0Z8D4_9CAUD|nr:hypothetical protein FDI98_gp104 [Vibrio phage JSF10]ASV43428.1 hypothetical protein [Vibrio phage JSF10]